MNDTPRGFFAGAFAVPPMPEQERMVEAVLFASPAASRGSAEAGVKEPIPPSKPKVLLANCGAPPSRPEKPSAGDTAMAAATSAPSPTPAMARNPFIDPLRIPCPPIS